MTKQAVKKQYISEPSSMDKECEDQDDYIRPIRIGTRNINKQLKEFLDKRCYKKSW